MRDYTFKEWESFKHPHLKTDYMVELQIDAVNIMIEIRDLLEKLNEKSGKGAKKGSGSASKDTSVHSGVQKPETVEKKRGRAKRKVASNG